MDTGKTLTAADRDIPHPAPRRLALLPFLVLPLLLAALPVAAVAADADAAALRDPFRPVLARPGLGGLPIHARIDATEGVVESDILTVVAHPPARVATLLASARGWCEFALLHHNVKACVEEPAAADGQRLVFYAGTRHYQPVEASRPLRYTLRVERDRGGLLSARLSPLPGPADGGDGMALVEVVGLDDARTGIRVRFRETLGAGTRLLAAGYFATFGRDKVGFTVTGADAHGRPTYVGGLAGAIERNAVRYFLALETTLAARRDADATTERRLSDWFARTERHARQLHEMDWAEYRDIKLRELAQSEALQRRIDARPAD